MFNADFLDQIRELLALLPAIIIILVPLILHILNLKRRRSQPVSDHELERGSEIQQPEKNERLTKTLVSPMPERVPYRLAVQTEYREEELPMPSMKVDRVLQNGESEAKQYTVIQKEVRRKLEAFPPLKRAVIWSEILGPPKRLSPD